jgi:hypothetical protein
MNELEVAIEILKLLQHGLDDKQQRVVLSLVHTVLNKGKFDQMGNY